MKSPATSPAFSATLPGSTLSMYCRAGMSEVGRKLRVLPGGSINRHKTADLFVFAHFMIGVN